MASFQTVGRVLALIRESTLSPGRFSELTPVVWQQIFEHTPDEELVAATGIMIARGEKFPSTAAIIEIIDRLREERAFDRRAALEHKDPAILPERVSAVLEPLLRKFAQPPKRSDNELRRHKAHQAVRSLLEPTRDGAPSP